MHDAAHLNDASLIPSLGADPINGSALTELVRQYNTTNAIITRLTRTIDGAALTAIMYGRGFGRIWTSSPYLTSMKSKT